MKIQKLALADQFFSDVKNGNKTKTLRWNEPEIKQGFLVFTSEFNASLYEIVYAQQIKYGTAKIFAPLYDMTPEALIESMQHHYKDISMNAYFMLVEYLTPKDTKKLEGYSEFKTLVATVS